MQFRNLRNASCEMQTAKQLMYAPIYMMIRCVNSENQEDEGNNGRIISGGATKKPFRHRRKGFSFTREIF